MSPSLGFSNKIGLRDASAIAVVVVAILPLLAMLGVLWRSGLLETVPLRVGLLLTLVLAVVGFVVFRRMIDYVAGRVDSVTATAGAGSGASPPLADVPGAAQAAEIALMGDAFSRMVTDLRDCTSRLEDFIHKMNSLNEVVESASRIPGIQDLLALVLERTMHTVHASIGSIMLLDRERRVLRVVAAHGLPDEVRGAEVPVGEGVAGKVVQMGEPVLVDDIATDPRFDKGNDPKYGSGSFICLPVRMDDRIVGVMNLAKSAAVPPVPHAFSGTDLQFLTTLMTHVAYAVDNARLVDEAHASAARLRKSMEDLRTAQAHAAEGQSLRAVGEIASGMAHHLNNLLAIIGGRVQFLLLRAKDPDVRGPLEIIYRASQDAGEVVRRVLGVTALNHVAQASSVNLNDVAREVVELTKPRWQDDAQLRGLAILTDVDLQPIPAVAGEASQLREVLLNLVLNAIDAMPHGGTIRVATYASDEWVYCQVSDNGIGMSQDVRRRALEPFFTTKGPHGVGLGLSVADGILQRHGGDLDIQPRDEGGTMVTIRLPKATRLAGVTPAPEARGTPLRILVIDDEIQVRAALADSLVDEGHLVVEAASGPEALAKIESGDAIDLVMTDLGMPGMTGWEVAREVHARWPDLPVGIVTGWAVTVEMRTVERAQIAFLVPKPYTLDALRAALAPIPRRLP